MKLDSGADWSADWTRSKNTWDSPADLKATQKTKINRKTKQSKGWWESARLVLFPAGSLGYESSYLEGDAGNRVLSHNWMFVPGQFFRAHYQRMGCIAGTALWRWGTLGALRGERDRLNGMVELAEDGWMDGWSAKRWVGRSACWLPAEGARKFLFHCLCVRSFGFIYEAVLMCRTQAARV